MNECCSSSIKYATSALLRLPSQDVAALISPISPHVITKAQVSTNAVMQAYLLVRYPKTVMQLVLFIQ